MKHRYDNIDFCRNAFVFEQPFRFCIIEIVLAEFGAHVHVLTFFQQFRDVSEFGQVKQFVAGVPFSVFGYIDRNDVVFVAINGIDGLVG